MHLPKTFTVVEAGQGAAVLMSSTFVVGWFISRTDT